MDYHKLNDLLKKDSYLLPRIDSTLDELAGSTWFSTLDLKSGVPLTSRVEYQLGIHKTRTTALHPQSDGIVERYNRTVENQLATFVQDHQKDWDIYHYF